MAPIRTRDANQEWSRLKTATGYYRGMTATQRPSFIVGRETGREEAVVVGLTWLFATATDGQRLLVTPVKDQLVSGDLGEALGNVGPALASGKAVSDPNGNTLRAATSRTFPPNTWPGGPVLAAWPDAKSLAKLDEHFRVQALCVIPWLYEWVEPWAAGRQAVDLLAPSQVVKVPPISDPVVEQAMKSLTIAVNLSTGLAHPSDKAAAVNTFRALKKARIGWEPAQIEPWAIANGWAAQDARALRSVAQGVLDGRRYQVDSGQWRSDIVSIWRAEAAKDRLGKS